MPKNSDTNTANDREIRRRLCADVLGGNERWHSESDRRRAKRYYFESSSASEADESEISGFLRKAVLELIRDMEHGEAREAKAGQPAFDFTPLRKTLGLEGE